MPRKQASKRYEYRRKAVKDNRKYVATLAIAIVVAAAFLIMRDNQITAAAADGRLGVEQTVIGVYLNGTARAYIFDGTDLVNDAINGNPILVTNNGVYERRIKGRVLEFTLENGRIFDSNGREWDIDGTSRYGTLNKINAPVVPWYTWLSWHPQTEIYKSQGY